MSIDSQLERVLNAAAPPVDDTEVWEQLQPQIRRARRRHRVQLGLGAGAAAAAVAIVAVGVLGAPPATRESGPATGPVLEATTTVPTTGDDATKTTEPETPGSVAVPVDGALDAVDAWIQALAAGDADAAWDLLSISSQATNGRDGFDSAFTELEEGFGSWGNATPALSGEPIEIGRVPAVLVAISGTRTVEGMVEDAISVLPAVFEDGAWRVEWYLPAVDGFAPSPRPESSVPFSPTGPVEWTGTGDGVNLLLVDGEPVSGLEEVPEGGGQAHVTWVPPEPLPAGGHFLSFVAGRHRGPITVLTMPVFVAEAAD